MFPGAQGTTYNISLSAMSTSDAQRENRINSTSETGKKFPNVVRLFAQVTQLVINEAKDT